MRRLSVLCFLTGLALVLGAALAQGGLAVYTGQATITDNTFTSIPVFPVDTGWLDPSAEAADTGGDGDGFESTPNEALTDGSSFAENWDGPGDRHRFYDYGISVPGGSSVFGVEVRLDWWLTATDGTNSLSVELSWDGGTSWTAAKTDTLETTSEHAAVLGARNDTWDRAWTVSELSDANFRVRVTCNSDSSSLGFDLDWIPVKIHYIPP